MYGEQGREGKSKEVNNIFVRINADLDKEKACVKQKIG